MRYGGWKATCSLTTVNDSAMPAGRITSPNATFERTLLSLLPFPLLTAWACKLILGNLFSSGLAQFISSKCHPDGDYLLPYTSISFVDSGLCGMVVFFQEAMSTPMSMNFLTYFIGTAAPLVVLPIFISRSTRKSWFTAYPAIWGMLTQIFSLGVIMPLYWLAVILTGGFGERAERGRDITQSRAQAALFGIITGAIIPSIGMLVLNDPYVTAIWQLYPLYVSLAQYCHLYIHGKNQQPGAWLVQIIYIALFIVSSSTHISYVWPILFDRAALEAFFLPYYGSNNGTTVQINDFLKWDFIFGLGSTILATLWTASNHWQLYALLLWYAFMVPIIGPGSAVVGTVLWDEFRQHAI